MRLLLNLGFLVAFSIGYMAWGGGNSAFVAEVEYEILFKKKNLLEAITHPLILAGLLGQFALLYSAFMKKPNKILQILGISLLGIVMLLILVAGLLSLNFKIIVSVIPFIVLCIVYFTNTHKFFPNMR
jgi:hypothetical protein